MKDRNVPPLTWLLSGACLEVGGDEAESGGPLLAARQLHLVEGHRLDAHEVLSKGGEQKSVTAGVNQVS